MVVMIIKSGVYFIVVALQVQFHMVQGLKDNGLVTTSLD